MRAFMLLLLVGTLLAGCADNTSNEDPSDPTIPTPVPLPDDIVRMEFIGNPETNSTTGIWLHNNTAYLSGGSGLRIMDISDPTNVTMLRSDIPDTGSRDVDVMEHPNGNLYAVVGSSTYVRLVNVTDPELAQVEGGVSIPTHNIAVVPNSTIVYNSRSISLHVPAPGETGRMDIIDFADPANPTVTPFNFPAVILDPSGVPRPVASMACHDMTFNAELERAYCAGVTDTTIWDISDPSNPEIIQVIDWPGTNIHHGVWDARGGDLLILGDEFGGVATPSPPCTTEGTTPTSALWFFDISDLATPTPVGYFQIEHAGFNPESPGVPRYCSTHFGEVIEDRDMLVMGWYSAGTVLIDFSDTMNAEQVAHHYRDGTNTWEARYYNGHIYTGDTGLGMDVLRLG